jgi:HEAT repeats
MRGLWLGVALLAGAAAGEPAAVPPAAESTALVEALERAPWALAGTIEGRTALDASGWRARLVVETVLLGAAEPGERVVIAWEELASERPVRFANGDRVLLALEPLAAGSLWRQRFGDPAAVFAARGIAQRGTAFLRAPSLGSLSLLSHYLRLPAALRPGPAGQRHLIALVADGEPALALSAARRLASFDAGDTLGADAAEPVLHAFAREDAGPELASLLGVWIERQQPVGLIPALDAALARPGGAPATIVRARGLLGAGLPPDSEAALLKSPSSAQRAAAASVASPAQAGRLADLLRHDAVPEVRVAALKRLARLEGPASLESLLDAFGDADARVRQEAAQHVAAFGPEALPRLRDSASWPWPAPETAVLALRFANSAESRAALTELADAHPDRRVRALAALALGRDIGHRD